MAVCAGRKVRQRSVAVCQKIMRTVLNMEDCLVPIRMQSFGERPSCRGKLK